MGMEFRSSAQGAPIPAGRTPGRGESGGLRLRTGMRHEGCDIVIVGARCAGAPLATLLARRGLMVMTLEQGAMPSPAFSSHVKQADSVVFLNRLGVLDRVRATGAPFTEQIDARIDDFRLIADIPVRPGDLGGGACIRRRLLDEILFDAACEAGADVRTGARVTEVVEERGRVAGVRATCGDSTFTVHARLVVGADGRRSTVARSCGARSYNVVPNARAYYWSYFEGADLSVTPRFVFHRWGDRFVIANPADSGLYMVGVSPEAHERDEFRRNLEPMFMDHVRSCEPTAAITERACLATKIYGILRFDGYFREAAGPGWVLVGDAGHFKDPAAGRGIGDAFRQVDALVPAVLEGLASSPSAQDRALSRWARWRDREFTEHYWLGADFGAAGPLPLAAVSLFQRLCATGGTDSFVELLSHRTRPSKVITYKRMAGANARTFLQRDLDRRAVAAQTGLRVRQEIARRWRRRRPCYEPLSSSGTRGLQGGSRRQPPAKREAVAR